MTDEASESRLERTVSREVARHKASGAGPEPLIRCSLGRSGGEGRVADQAEVVVGAQGDEGFAR